MIVWLDHKIFGNGHGLKSPFHDDNFYWISGELYNWSGWLGAQLQSFQWRHPNASEVRELNGRRYKPFGSYRKFMWWKIFPLPIARVQVSWALTDLPDDLDKANETLRKIQKELGEL
jgi:hypothetical protein